MNSRRDTISASLSNHAPLPTLSSHEQRQIARTNVQIGSTRQMADAARAHAAARAAMPARRDAIAQALDKLATPSTKDDRQAGLHVPGRAIAHLQRLSPEQQHTAGQLLQAFHRAPSALDRAKILQHVHQTLGENPQAFLDMYKALVKDGVMQ